MSLHTVGMKPKATAPARLSREEILLIEQLRQQPLIRAQVESILALARNAEGPLKTADEVEGLLIEEMRRLGNTTLGAWAIQAEERVSRELQHQDPTVRSRKKNANLVVCLREGVSAGTHLVQSNPSLSAPVAAALGRQSPGKIASSGTSPDGLWL